MQSITQNSRCSVSVPTRRVATITAVYKKKVSPVVEKEPKNAPQAEAPKKKDELKQTLNKLNSSATSTKRKDQELLDAARSGKLSEGKLSPEQYAALRRKIGGTARDYFKDWVEEEQVKLPTYYKPNDAIATVPFLPLLVGVLVAVLGATVFVVQQTGAQ